MTIDFSELTKNFSEERLAHIEVMKNDFLHAALMMEIFNSEAENKEKKN